MYQYTYIRTAENNVHSIRSWKRTKRLCRLVLLLGISTLVGVTLEKYLYSLHHFQVQSIRISGASFLDPQTIVAISGITNQYNMLTLDINAIRQRILSCPYVQDCVLRRILPNILEIQITERIPVATLAVHNRFFAIARDGTVLEELAPNKDHIGVLITDLPQLEVVEPGQKIDVPELQLVFEMLDAFQSTEFASTVTISEISARSRNDIRLYCDNLPFEIRWGRGNFLTQAKRLDALWKYMNKQFDFTEYCDLRFGQDIVCR